MPSNRRQILRLLPLMVFWGGVLLTTGCGTLVAWGLAGRATYELATLDERGWELGTSLGHDVGLTRSHSMEYKRFHAERDETLRFSNGRTRFTELSIHATTVEDNRTIRFGPVLAFREHDFDVKTDGLTAGGDSDTWMLGAFYEWRPETRPLFFKVQWAAGRSRVNIPQLAEDPLIRSSDLRGSGGRLIFRVSHEVQPWLSLTSGLAIDTMRLPADTHINDDAPVPGRMPNGYQSYTGFVGLQIHWTF